MEPITLCGAVIVVYCLWVEFEPFARRIATVAVRIRFWNSRPLSHGQKSGVV